MNNLFDVIKKNDCTGCGLCEYVCPAKAIQVKENKKGFLKFDIDENKCINCGLCKKVCHLDLEQKPNDFSLYGGRSKNSDVLKTSRSGGIFYHLSKYVLDKGGLVFGAAFDDNFEVKHICIDSIKDMYKLQGSKYVQSTFKEVFSKVVEANGRGQLVLVSGTACQISSLRSLIKYKNLDESKIILVDILCFGVPSKKIFRRYIKSYKRSKVIGFEFRNKSFGWDTHIESMYTLKKGKIDTNLYASLFGSKLIINKNCFSCHYKNLDRPGDFSIGDFWGLKQYDRNLYSDFGNTLLFVNNLKAIEIFNFIKIDFDNFEVDKNTEYWKQPVLTNNWSKPKKYDLFWKFPNFSFFLYLKAFKFKKFIKKIIKHLKNSF